MDQNRFQEWSGQDTPHHPYGEQMRPQQTWAEQSPLQHPWDGHMPAQPDWGEQMQAQHAPPPAPQSNNPFRNTTRKPVGGGYGGTPEQANSPHRLPAPHTTFRGRTPVPGETSPSSLHPLGMPTPPSTVSSPSSNVPTGGYAPPTPAYDFPHYVDNRAASQIQVPPLHQSQGSAQRLHDQYTNHAGHSGTPGDQAHLDVSPSEAVRQAMQTLAKFGINTGHESTVGTHSKQVSDVGQAEWSPSHNRGDRMGYASGSGPAMPGMPPRTPPGESYPDQHQQARRNDQYPGNYPLQDRQRFTPSPSHPGYAMSQGRERQRLPSNEGQSAFLAPQAQRGQPAGRRSAEYPPHDRQQFNHSPAQPGSQQRQQFNRSPAMSGYAPPQDHQRFPSSEPYPGFSAQQDMRYPPGEPNAPYPTSNYHTQRYSPNGLHGTTAAPPGPQHGYPQRGQQYSPDGSSTNAFMDSPYHAGQYNSDNQLRHAAYPQYPHFTGHSNGSHLQQANQSHSAGGHAHGGSVYLPTGSNPISASGSQLNIGYRAPSPPPQREEPQVPMANLEGIPELNILILGETGVGKSTFINAFANYLAFKSLDDALDQRSLKCVIPSNFTWQTLQGQSWASRQINVKPNSGSHTDTRSLQHEKDVPGESATQETKTYEMQVGRTTVRLLDTPGIGDTRGRAQDKKNMDDILAKLREVSELHGILILLKPNNARLGLMFSFCLKELLTHLHRDAAKNIVFGFTNARNTSFRPGETYSTLKAMLDAPDNRTIGIQLDRNITYCFDSESFRCLAAHHDGIDVHDMGDIKDYTLSWEKSSAETYRMLEHFRPSETAPHRVEETWNLYRTRELVRVLTIPMADITQTINNNITLQEEQQRELTDSMAKGEALESALHLDKIEFEMHKLDKPRTVCADKGCVEYHDDAKHYKSMCHDPCYLDNVEVDKMACPQLMQCYAFGCGSEQNCIKCGHSWQVHLHVLWEPVEVKVKAIDESVQTRLQENATGMEVMEEAIKSRQDRISRYKQERQEIQKAAGQFAVFLKNSAITPWNDSTLAYLDHLIDQEQGKVAAGGSKKRLQELQADRRQHEEEIRTLTEYAKQGAKDKLLDQEGIKNLIAKLFALELTGANLKKVAQQLEDIQASTQKGKSISKKGFSSMGFLPSTKVERKPSKQSPSTGAALTRPSAPSLPSWITSTSIPASNYGGAGAPSFEDMLAANKKNRGLKGFLSKLTK